MKIIITVVLVTFIYIFSMVNMESYRNHQLGMYNPNNSINSNQNSNVISEEISVEIRGEVSKPGKYTLKKDSTFDDLIKKAGLTLESADESCYNLDYVLEDKMTYYIPKNGDSKISINNANKETLMMLTGIGDATSDRIIQYREEVDEFHCLEDIMKVPGIKELTFNKIRDYIKL